MSIKNVAIIGAGWSGLQTAKIFIDCGYNVTIYEELDDVGGTWNPLIAYYGLTIHAPLHSCQFHNFQKFEHHNPLKKMAAKDMFQYCKAYCSSSNLYQYIKFRHKIEQLEYNSKNKISILKGINVCNNMEFMHEYDFVISTQFNFPRIPTFCGQEQFTGKIYHSNDIKEDIFEECIQNNLNVVILGASKSGTDMAINFARRNYNVTWLIKKMYWFCMYDKLCYNLKTGKKPSIFYRYMHLFGVAISSNNYLAVLTMAIWYLTGIIQCPGKLHFDFRKFHYGFIDSDQFNILNAQTEKVYGEIEYLDGSKIYLKDNSVLDCDVLICATGSDPFKHKIKLFKDGTELKYEEIDRLYENSVIPELPRLSFTGLILLGFGPTNGFHRAAIILKYIEDNLTTEQLKTILVNEKKIIGESNFATSSILFDSSGYILVKTNALVKKIISKFSGLKDQFNFVYGFTIKLQLKPLSGAEKYVNNKIKEHLNSRNHP